MLFRKKTANYVSEIDKFLEEFDKTHALTKTQELEFKKHQRIAELRDQPHPERIEKKLWQEF